MIKVLNQYFPGRLVVLLATENLLILLIWAAVSLQLGVWHSTAHDTLIFKALVATVICQLCLYYADVYDLRSIESRAEVFFRLLQALSAASLVLTFLFLVVPDFGLDSSVVEVSIVATVFLLLAWRLAVDGFARAYGRSERILLVGSAVNVQKLFSEVKRRPELPIELLGTVSNGEMPASLEGLANLGSLSCLESVVDEMVPDRVIIGLEERRQALPLKTLLKLRMRGLQIEEASALYQKITGKIPVESIYPSSLIFSDGFSQSTLRLIYERVFSLLGGILFLILFGPLMLLVSIAIKLDSRGPVLYAQTRVGKGGRQFEILKFRSMYADAESASGPIWAQENDPRITRVGRIIRKLRIDEFPQILNVMCGHMGFVGPRPERPHFVAQLVEQIPYYELRHSARPGVTGWAQVSCDYGATVEEAKLKLEYDLFYLKNASFWFDLMILFQTIKIVLLGRGAR